MLDVTEYLLSDVLVIGGGPAGCRAAVEAVEYVADVIIVDQGVIGGAGHQPADDVTYAAAIPRDDWPDTWRGHFEDTVRAGEYIGDQRLARILAREALRNAHELERYGLRWSRAKNGYFDQQGAPGHRYPRRLHVNGGTHETLSNALVSEARRHVGIRIVDNTFISTLLQHRGEVVGAVGIEKETGDVLVFTAGSVILATGGVGTLYGLEAGGGMGMALGYRIGAALVAPELHQFDPAAERGKTYRYTLGGLRINEHCETNMPGLYAAGEAAGGTHGACVLPGNELTDAMVFGAVAGRSAALARRRVPRIKEEGVKDELLRLRKLLRGKKGYKGERVSLAQIHSRLISAVREFAGPVRTAASLTQAAGILRELSEESLLHVQISDSDASVAKIAALIELIETENMLQIARLIVQAAQMRTETRGAHVRPDYPDTDDNEWLSNIVVRTEQGDDNFSTIPVELSHLCRSS
ncbi:MAG: FAD-binding protein [Anaerolineae bacterium]